MNGVCAEKAADRPQVLALRVPADVSRPVSLLAVGLTAEALSEVIEGCLLGDSTREDIGGVGFTVFVNEQQVAKGLPSDERAAVLSTRLGEVDRQWLAGRAVTGDRVRPVAAGYQAMPAQTSPDAVQRGEGGW